MNFFLLYLHNNKNLRGPWSLSFSLFWIDVTPKQQLLLSPARLHVLCHRFCTVKRNQGHESFDLAFQARLLKNGHELKLSRSERLFFK